MVTAYIKLPFLHVLSLVALATGQVLTSNSIRTAHWLLRNAEDMHRSFTILHGVEVLKAIAIGDPKQICKTSVLGTDSSRKLFEESWTGVSVSGTLDLDAVFNGSCFATSAQSCATYSECETAGYDAYPQVRDVSTGLQVFNPNADALKALRWAVNQDFVESWQMEQQSLVQNLPADKSSKEAVYLTNKISAATAEVDKAVYSNTHALLKMLDERVTAFDALVKTASAHPQGTALPQSFRDLAAKMSTLVEAMENAPCSQASWPGLRQDVVTMLESEDDALAAVNAATLLQALSFDYTWRVAEALLVSASLALQTVVLSTIVEVNCLLDSNPYSAAMEDASDAQTKAFALIEKLKDKFPLAPSGTVAPLQHCLSGRIAAAMQAISTSSMAQLTTSSLLSLDFCKQLFDGTANQVISVAPYTEAAPPLAPMTFVATSSEQREIRFDSQNGFAYVEPYASFSSRPGQGSSQFAINDKVVKLQLVADNNVREKGSANPVSDCCTIQDCLTQYMDAHIRCYGMTQPCGGGCIATGSTRCQSASPGFYSLEGDDDAKECPNMASLQNVASFLVSGWPNSSCPFFCKNVDDFQDGDGCTRVDNGWYSAPCENGQFQCQTPTGMDASLFRALVAFTSSGFGAPLGCEVSLAFPFVMKTQALLWSPPFTVELFVKVAVSSIPSASPTEFAMLTGVFPRWFLGLRRSSDNSVKITFYHSEVTLTSQGRQTSLVDSKAIPWSTDWHHIAVVVPSKEGSPTSKNIFFYVDGVEVDAAYRSVIPVLPPQVPVDHNDCFHIGPPNIGLFPSVLQAGRGEPYFNVSGIHSFYEAEIDEVRIHKVSLDSFTSGFFLTELSRREACDIRTARLEGHCKPRSIFTPNNNLNSDRSYCAVGYEPCGAHPGMCLPACKPGMLRQPDCTCDCATGKFQVWLVKVIHLTGSGRVRSAIVYDSSHHVVANKSNWQLNDRIDLGSTTEVAVIVVRGGASAIEVSLEVETADGTRMPVPTYHNLRLTADRDVTLLHEKVNDFFDMSFECVNCPGQALGSTLPRINALSCSCADGYDGRNLLGECVPRHSRLPPPVILPTEQYQTAGTSIQLSFPSFQTEGSWLAVIRYEWLRDPVLSPTAPNCESSPKYDGTGLNIIQREKRVVVRAVLCHPLHFDSNITEMTFTGNKHLDPPACNLVGIKSTSSTYALNVAVSITVDNEPGAIIKLTIDGGPQHTYAGRLYISKAGATEIIAEASQDQYDNSMPTTCRFSIDGPARVVTRLEWLTTSTPAGFVYEDMAFLVPRSQAELNFKLLPSIPGGAALSTPVQTEYRLWHRPIGSAAAAERTIQEWTAVADGGSIQLDIDAHRLLWGSQATTVLRIEWRTKEFGYILSNNQSTRLILLSTKSVAPTNVTTASETWSMDDSWTPGPLRESVLRQVHYVELFRPAADAQIVFGIGTDIPTSLLKANTQNVSSILSGGLVHNFLSHAWSPEWTPDELATHCSSAKLCYYSGRLKVLGGETVYAFALQAGKLESDVTSWVVPKDLEPDRDDQNFHVSVTVDGALSTILQSPGIYVLPSVAENFSFSLDRDGEDRRSCVLVSLYTVSGDPPNMPGLPNCTWLDYQGKRMLERSKLYKQLKVDPSSSLSINVTILTTIRKPGMLWAYPRSTTYLWLRSRAAPPAIEIVLAPAPVPAPAAMVWLPLTEDASMSSQVASAQPTATSFQCYFTVNYVDVGATLPPNWLNAVPNHAGSVPTVAEALRKTTVAVDAKSLAEWRDDVEKCAWPSVCVMPLGGTLSTELIRTPSSLPIVCAWVMVSGYSESTPTCARVEETSRKVVKPYFASPQGTDDVSLLSQEDWGVTLVGREDRLNADVLLIRQPGLENPSDALRRRLASSWTDAALRFGMDNSHPLQYRHSVRSETVANIISDTQGVLDRMQPTEPWKNWTKKDTELAFPLQQHLEDHALFEVDTKLLTGINSWSPPQRALAIALTGEHSEPTARTSNRTVFLDKKHLQTSTLLYRWTLGVAEEPTPRDGSSVYSLELGFSAIELAYVLDARIGDCIVHDAAEEKKVDKQLGPRLCAAPYTQWSGLNEMSLPAPDHRRWGLWAAAYAAGLPLSESVLVIVEAQCLTDDGDAPNVFQNALTPVCKEGGRINSGSTCTPQCAPGYVPSEVTLKCVDGNLVPSTFSCQEAPCSFSTTQNQSCNEGSAILSGSRCSPSCTAGYLASVPELKCDKGVLTPLTFECYEAPCIAPANILRAAAQPCSGLAIVPSGHTCEPQCQSGHKPSLTQLSCSKGVLTPPSFTCLESACEAPSGVRFATNPPCLEGTEILPQMGCTPLCQLGYSASEVFLTCSQGVLSPSTFACEGMPCSTPTDIANGGVPACQEVQHEGQLIAKGGVCTPRCQQGFDATVASLGCGNGSLSPSTFECVVAVAAEESSDVDTVLIVAVIVIALCLVGLGGAFFARRGISQVVVLPDEGDVLEGWLLCLLSVNRGTCVFCGSAPFTSKGEESANGPMTFFQSCEFCAEVLAEQNAAKNVGMDSMGVASEIWNGQDDNDNGDYPRLLGAKEEQDAFEAKNGEFDGKNLEQSPELQPHREQHIDDGARCGVEEPFPSEAEKEESLKKQTSSVESPPSSCEGEKEQSHQNIRIASKSLSETEKKGSLKSQRNENAEKEQSHQNIRDASKSWSGTEKAESLKSQSNEHDQPSKRRSRQSSESSLVSNNDRSMRSTPSRRGGGAHPPDEDIEGGTLTILEERERRKRRDQAPSYQSVSEATVFQPFAQEVPSDVDSRGNRRAEEHPSLTSSFANSRPSSKGSAEFRQKLQEETIREDDDPRDNFKSFASESSSQGSSRRSLARHRDDRRANHY